MVIDSVYLQLVFSQPPNETTNSYGLLSVFCGQQDFYTVPRLLTKHAAPRPLRKYYDAASVSGSLSRREQRPQAMTSSGRPDAAKLEWAATTGYRLCLLKISSTLFRKSRLRDRHSQGRRKHTTIMFVNSGACPPWQGTSSQVCRHELAISIP